MIDLAISLLALGIAALAYLETKKQTSASLRLTAQEIELVRQQIAANRAANQESRQARVSARVFKDGKTWRIRVFNAGPSVARNVILELSEDNIMVSREATDGKFPMSKLEAGQSVDIWADVHSGTPPKETLIIKWEDSYSSARENRVELTL